MKVEITKAQIKAIVHICDDIEAMIGGAYSESGENTDQVWNKKLTTIDRFFEKNNIDKNDFR